MHELTCVAYRALSVLLTMPLLGFGHINYYCNYDCHN